MAEVEAGDAERIPVGNELLGRVSFTGRAVFRPAEDSSLSLYPVCAARVDNRAS